METSLHRQLKAHYAGDDGSTEVVFGGYRIDAIRNGELVEIQHGSLAAIRDKIRRLLGKQRVRVVKPIVANKLLKLDGRGGVELSRRRSPKRGVLLDVFEELVYFTRVFPHNRLVLEVVLVDVEERRFPGCGKRRRRRPASDFQIEDQVLVKIVQSHSFATIHDLLRLLPRGLPAEFHTGHLADRLKAPRWTAQRMAYCLREMKAVKVVGKQGNALLYKKATRRAA
jgi:hypothetical protein